MPPTPRSIVSCTYGGQKTNGGYEVAFLRTFSDGSEEFFNLPPRYDLEMHSMCFDWGRRGRGPKQLALALVAHATKDDKLALGVYKVFAEKVVLTLDEDCWFLDAESIKAAVNYIKDCNDMERMIKVPAERLFTLSNEGGKLVRKQSA